MGAKVIFKDYDILVFFFSILSYLEGNRKNIKTWTKVEKSSNDAKELSKTFDQNLVKTKKKQLRRPKNLGRRGLLLSDQVSRT